MPNQTINKVQINGNPETYDVEDTQARQGILDLGKKTDKQIEQISNDLTQKTNQLKEDLGNQKKAINELADKKITKFYASNQGEIHITDSDNGKIQDMMVYGKSSQDGTPSIESPVEIKSVVNPTVKITNEDGLKVQSVMFDNITLNAIPVSSGGNVTINGQQYIADYVDVGKINELDILFRDKFLLMK